MALDSEVFEDLLKAGRIASEALNHGFKLIKPGVTVRSVLDSVESKIRDLGGNIAFPAQSSLSNQAAHYCPDDSDDTVYSEEDVVKLDVGVHINGWVADTALTKDLSGAYSDLLRASREALREALKLAVPGSSPLSIGSRIEEVISSFGFSPVRNLSGHGIGRFVVHSSPSIPNVSFGSSEPLKEGDLIAIEPFASTGAGRVVERGVNTLFSQVSHRNVRLGRFLLSRINSFNGLPFTTRWLTREFGLRAVAGLKSLVRQGVLREYPPLVDSGLVSQAEHSVIVGEKPVVFTQRPDE